MAGQRRWMAVLPGLLLATALVGCRSTPEGQANDPIRGGTAPIPSGVGGSLTQGGRPAVPALPDVPPGHVPPLPMPRSSTGLAALATSSGVPASGAAAGGAGAANEAGVTMGGPRPPGGAAPPAAAGGDSFESLQQALRVRGVSDQNLATTGKPDEWQFSCLVPIDAYTNTRYAATAVGPGGVAAMRAVLDKIDRKQP